MYQLEISKQVRRQIDDLPGHVRQRIKCEIARLSFDPRSDQSEELQSALHGYHKIKLDRYRIVYRIDDEAAVVQVLKAGKKHTGFYDDLLSN